MYYNVNYMTGLFKTNYIFKPIHMSLMNNLRTDLHNDWSTYLALSALCVLPTEKRIID